MMQVQFKSFVLSSNEMILVKRTFELRPRPRLASNSSFNRRDKKKLLHQEVLQRELSFREEEKKSETEGFSSSNFFLFFQRRRKKEVQRYLVEQHLAECQFTDHRTKNIGNFENTYHVEKRFFIAKRRGYIFEFGFTRGQKIRTQDGWEGNANATLPRPSDILS